ncbi:two-component sensor histidine kinase [Nostocoides sp. F2B08]|nr:two-component sensor histidine kinase [Tetrasphaera sp. F2B08]
MPALMTRPPPRPYRGLVPWPKRVTVALWAATAVLLLLSLWATIDLGGRANIFVTALSWVVVIAPLAAGYLVIRHDPANWVGTWLTAAGTAIALINAHGTWQDALAAEPSGLPASPLLWVLTQGVWMAWFVPYAMVVALFPDGRPWGRVGRASVVALLTIPVLFNLLTAVIPEPLMPPLDDWPRPLGTHPVGYLSLALLPFFLLALIGPGVSLWRRHAASTDPRARAQMRWMLLAASLLPATLVLCWVGYLVVGGPEPVVVGLVAFNLAMPAATFVAMLRHDLYDVDRAIVLAGVYGILAVGVLAGYALVSGLLGRTLGADSVTAAVVATVAVMIALLPARSFLLRVLGRRLHPRRAAALDAVAALAERVGAGRDEPERLEEVLREALRDDGLRVGYRRPGGTAYLDVSGEPVEDVRGQPIRSGGHDVGLVVPGPRGAPVPSEILTASGLLADQVRLRRELADALAEVEASRERLLEAGYEERRRLETDLHDGAQQRLVSLGMRLRVAQRHAASGQPVDLDTLVDTAVTQIADAVGELRAIAHGLRPSSLDDGLPAALDNLTRSSALPVEVSYSANGIPDHVSLTAYYVASEGVANAVKHAGASRVAIDVRHDDEHLRVVVRDDGAGGAKVVPGSGLARLRDRVHAHGGSLDVSSPLAQGTSIEAVIPCGS